MKPPRQFETCWHAGVMAAAALMIQVPDVVQAQSVPSRQPAVMQRKCETASTNVVQGSGVNDAMLRTATATNRAIHLPCDIACFLRGQ
jgi:hypothetical protein